MKIVSLVLANDGPCACSRCNKQGLPYKNMIQAVRDTWASRHSGNVKTYYMYGHREGVEFPENSAIMMCDETYWPISKGDGGQGQHVLMKRKPFAVKDCIYSDTPGDNTPNGRDNLWYKTLDGFQWLLENEEFDYLLRPCASNYVDLTLVEKFLQRIGIKNDIYAGSVAQYKNVKYASGSFYILSRNLVEKLVESRLSLEPVRSPYASATIIDDVTVGKVITKDFGIKIIDIPKIQLTSVVQIEQAAPAIKNIIQCYFQHAAPPQLHHEVHKIKCQ